jgi:uncharacterized membrane protein YbhN (UPF0104 family)
VAAARDTEDVRVAQEPMPEELEPRRLRRRLIELALLGVATGAVVTALPGLGHLRDRLGDANGWFVALTALLELASCLSYLVVFRDVFCPRMARGFAYNLAMAEQATNVLVPTGGAGGLALGAWALRQGGMSTEYIGRRSVAFFIFTSIPNFTVAAIGGALLALHVLPGHGPLVPTVVLASLAALGMVLVAALPRLLGWIDLMKEGGRIRRAFRASVVTLADGVRDTGGLLHPLRVRATAGSLGYMGFDVAALAAAFAAFGSPPQFGSLLFAYVIGQLGGLIPLPGGIGGTDGGLIGALVLYDTPLAHAAAAVLVYRAFQLGMPALLGAVAFTRLRKTLAGSSRPAELCAPLAEPLPVVSLKGGG